MQNKISFTPQKLTQFKTAIEAAEKSGADCFKFEGAEFNTRYAYYFAQHIENHFAQQRAKMN